MDSRLTPLSGAFNGLAQKIRFARTKAEEALSRPAVRSFAEAAAGRGTRYEQAQRMFYTLRSVVNYVADPVGAEFIKAPWVMVEEIRERGFAAGDCDDQATLAYTLLRSIGIPSKLRVGWYGSSMPGHIYAVAQLNGQWVAFDTTNSVFGREKPNTHAEDF